MGKQYKVLNYFCVLDRRNSRYFSNLEPGAQLKLARAFYRSEYANQTFRGNLGNSSQVSSFFLIGQTNLLVHIDVYLIQFIIWR